MSLKDEYFCPNCNAVLNNQPGFDPDGGTWTCTECGTTLYGDDIEETMDLFDGVVWYCDSCGAVLNRQSGFNDYCGTWYCTECGHPNSINENEIYESEEEYQEKKQVYECPSCGATLNEQWGFNEDDTYTCSSCYACLKREDNEYKIKYECPACGFELNDQWDFDEDDYWTCEVCGEKLYKDDNHYEISYDAESEQDNDYHEQNYSQKSNEPDSTTSNERNQTEKKAAHTPHQSLKPKRKLHWKTKLKIAFGIIIAVIVALGCYESTNLIPVSSSADMLVGKQYKDVVAELESAGFSNVSTKEIADLSAKQISEEYAVTEVKIGLITSFSDTTKLPSNFPVTVTYHTLETVATPMSNKEAKGSNYKKVQKAFKDAGFINVSTKVEYDIITGWFVDDGEVKSVTVAGDKKYDSGDEYKLNSDVVITYHTFRKNKPD